MVVDVLCGRPFGYGAMMNQTKELLSRGDIMVRSVHGRSVEVVLSDPIRLSSSYCVLVLQPTGQILFLTAKIKEWINVNYFLLGTGRTNEHDNK